MNEYIEIDAEYASVIVSKSKEERIEYLEKVIDQKQNILRMSGNDLSNSEKFKLIDAVKMAQIEIKRVMLEK